MNLLIITILTLNIIAGLYWIVRLIEERDNAEERAITHFKRAGKFEKQLKETVKEYNEQAEILLDNASELRSEIKNLKSKVTDLENNIELLKNNLSDENKELISDDQSEN